MSLLVTDDKPVTFHSIEKVWFPRLRVLVEAVAEVFTLWRDKYFPRGAHETQEAGTDAK
jgi:hypothetical protein